MIRRGSPALSEEEHEDEEHEHSLCESDDSASSTSSAKSSRSIYFEEEGYASYSWLSDPEGERDRDKREVREEDEKEGKHYHHGPNGQRLYVVAKVLARRRRVEDNEIEYKTRFHEFPPANDMWLPRENIPPEEDRVDQVAIFQKALKRQKKQRRRAERERAERRVLRKIEKEMKREDAEAKKKAKVEEKKKRKTSEMSSQSRARSRTQSFATEEDDENEPPSGAGHQSELSGQQEQPTSSRSREETSDDILTITAVIERMSLKGNLDQDLFATFVVEENGHFEFVKRNQSALSKGWTIKNLVHNMWSGESKEQYSVVQFAEDLPLCFEVYKSSFLRSKLSKKQLKRIGLTK